MDLYAELNLVTQDVKDAIVVIDDPELQDDLGELIVELESVAQLISSAEAGAAKPLAESLLDATEAIMNLPGLTQEMKLAVFAVRTVLRRIAVS